MVAITAEHAMLLLIASSLLVCSHHAAGHLIWPQPQQHKTFDELLLIDPFTFEFLVDERNVNCSITNEALKRYAPLIFDRSCPGETTSVSRPDTSNLPHPLLPAISISFQSCDEFPYEGMDESYMIKILGPDGASLTAPSSWGVIRGLETLSHMIHQANKTLGSLYQVRHHEIVDYPRFPYRGVMIDTSRHFIPMAILKQNLDAMAFNKMNVFHWHIVDDQSFPYQSIKFPDMQQQGAYNVRTHVYSQRDVQEIIEYARLRGIRVVPEFDTPGHTLSWSAIPNLLTECYEDGKPSGKLGPMDPTSESTYDFLRQFLEEIASVFPDRDLHVGGDEVDFACWDSNPNITSFMERKGLTHASMLQQMFMARLINMTDQLDKNHIVWEEVFDNGAQLSSRSTVHVWLGNWQQEWQSKLRRITASGIRAILSSPWYLNHIKYGIDWEEFYKVEPINFEASEAQKKLVVGGSVCMWSEFVDGGEIIARTWPRASAVAERLWSSQDTRTTWWAAKRIQKMQCRMQQRGLRVGTINGPHHCPCDHTFT